MGGHIAALRIDLKLLQKHLGGQIDVDEAAITSWKRNASASLSQMELTRFTPEGRYNRNNSDPEKGGSGWEEAIPPL